jgi:hypothetical protein
MATGLWPGEGTLSHAGDLASLRIRNAPGVRSPHAVRLYPSMSEGGVQPLLT